jgi:hypothetical protein
VIPFRTLGQAPSPFADAEDRPLRVDPVERTGARRPRRCDLGWITIVVLELTALLAVVLAAGGSR